MNKEGQSRLLEGAGEEKFYAGFYLPSFLGLSSGALHSLMLRSLTNSGQRMSLPEIENFFRQFSLQAQKVQLSFPDFMLPPKVPVHDRFDIAYYTVF